LSEDTIVEILLLNSWAYEVAEGRRAEAADACRQALERWVQGGLTFSTGANGERLFDAIEVVNHLRWSGVAGADRFWRDHYVRSARRMALSDAPAEGPPNLNANPAAYRMQLRRDFAFDTPGAKVRLRAPTPLARPSLQDLKVVPYLQGGDVATDIAARREYLEARLLVPDAGRITVGADLTFVAAPRELDTAPLSAEETQLYLRKVEWPINVTPKIETLAEGLAADREAPLDVVGAFWDFMTDRLMYGMFNYSEAAEASIPELVLETGWYDCQAGSALLISLCRARGIPARMVSGHFLYPLAPTHHYWTEVWIEGRGWLPFDFFSWDLSDAGRDPAWRNVFAGAIDHRAVSQCFPTAFTGPMSVRFPAAWQMVVKGAAGGIEIAYFDTDTASQLYRERVAVERMGAAPPSP
jgi:hypothetical protein